MNWFWHAMWIGLVLIPVSILWLGCIFDIFYRDDMHPARQILWLMAILILPVLGALAYLIARPRRAGAFGQEGMGRRVVIAGSADAVPLSEQLADLDRMHNSGALDDREFQVAKEDALARVPAPRGATADAATAAAAGGGR
jgi:hypothetical protein